MDIASFVSHFNFDRTVRFVASARLRAPVLSKLVEEDDFEDLAEIEGATSGRLVAQETGADRLNPRELVFGISHAHFINAAFSYWQPKGLNRFNGPGRGAWYAALTVDTSIAEVTFHIERELAYVGDFNTTVDYAEMFAGSLGNFVDARSVDPVPEFLNPDPAVAYVPGNAFADAVRAAGHYGIVYPSVRHAGGTCMVALVPHAVQSVAQGRVLRFTWKGTPGPKVEEVT